MKSCRAWGRHHPVADVLSSEVVGVGSSIFDVDRVASRLGSREGLLSERRPSFCAYHGANRHEKPCRYLLA